MEYLGTGKPVNKITPQTSVCIITYNQALYISECLEGILMQETTFPFEIIIGDDDSTDGTTDICQNYAERYPDKIRLFKYSEKDKIFINKRKTGISNLVNTINNARSNYIALCEGDDYWLTKDKLQKQFDAIEQNPGIGGVFSDAIIGESVSDGIQFSSKYQPAFEKEQSSFEDIVKYGWFIPTATLFFRKNAIESDLFNSLITKVISTDYLIHLSITQHCGPLLRLNEVTSFYRLHENSINQHKNADRKFLFNKFMSLHNDFINFSKQVDKHAAAFVTKSLNPLGKAIHNQLFFNPIGAGLNTFRMIYLNSKYGSLSIKKIIRTIKKG